MNPRGGTILGETAWPDVASIPFPVDLVNVFRPQMDAWRSPSRPLPPAPAIWYQLRIVDLAAAERAAAAGLAVVLDRCMKMEHGGGRGRSTGAA